MKDIFEISNHIFKYLKNHIEKNSKYNPKVSQNIEEKKYPLVVFEDMLNNISSQNLGECKLDVVRSLNFEISIFAINSNGISSQYICEELSNLVCEIMQDKFNMQGGLDNCLKNINTDKATKYILHFNCEWNIGNNIISN